MEVSPKWMVYNGNSYQNRLLGGTPISGNLHIYVYIYRGGPKVLKWRYPKSSKIDFYMALHVV